MANIGSLVLTLQARTQSLEKQLNRANGLIRKLQKEVERISNSARKAERNSIRSFFRIGSSVDGIAKKVLIASRAMRALAVAAAAAIAGSFVTRTIQATDAIGKFADRLGINVVAFQELEFAASQSGVSLQTFQLGLQRFIRRAQEARDGNENLAQSFFDLGISAQDLRTVPIEELFQRALVASNRFENGLARLVKVVDSEAAALRVLGQSGAEGIERLRATAQRLGLTLDESLIKRAAEANDALDVTTRIISTRLTAAILGIAPQIAALGNSFARIVESMTNTGKAIDGLTSREAALAKFFTDAIGFARGLADAIGAAIESIEKLRGSISRGFNRVFGSSGSSASEVADLPSLPRSRPRRVVVEIDTSQTTRIERLNKAIDELTRDTPTRVELFAERTNKALGELAERRLVNRIEGAFQSIQGAIANAAVGIARGTQSISEAVRNMVDSIAASLLSSGVNQLLGLLSQFAVGAVTGGPAPAAIGPPTVTPVTAVPTGSFSPRGAAAPQVTVINVADQATATRLAAVEELAGRSVTISGLANDISSRGNGSPVVRSLRNTLGR